MRLILVLLLSLAAAPALAFNDDFHEGGEVLRASTSLGQTAAGLYLMAGAAARAGNTDGDFAAYLIGTQALGPALGHGVLNLQEVAARPGGMLDHAGYRDALAPLLGEIANMLRSGAVDRGELSRLARSLAELDKTAKANNLPGIDKVVTEVFGASAETTGLTKAIGALLKMGKIGRKGILSDAELDAELDARADIILGLLTPRMVPASILAPAVADIGKYNAKALNYSAQAIDLVTQAMRTGKFDDAAYAVLRDKLYAHISRGPWDSDTMKDMLVGWCAAIPELAQYCADMFRVVKYAMQLPACRAIGCDCGNVRGVVPRIYQQECRKHEADARLQCALAQRVVVGCRHPYGPAASPVE